MQSVPATTVFRRYRDNPEQLAAELHRQAQEIAATNELCFIDQRLADLEGAHDDRP